MAVNHTRPASCAGAYDWPPPLSIAGGGGFDGRSRPASIVTGSRIENCFLRWKRRRTTKVSCSLPPHTSYRSTFIDESRAVRVSLSAVRCLLLGVKSGLAVSDGRGCAAFHLMLKSRNSLILLKTDV